MRRSLALILNFSLLAAAQIATPRIKPPKKEKEPETQALPLLPEPPAAVVAETGKLVFHVSPLSNKGLLTQQVRDALKALDRANGDATFVKLRAFVAGTGDMRRVAAIVSEDFSEKKMPLPAVTTVQVGALPMEGAQVVIESISADKKTVNPNGLVFFSASPPANLAAAANAQQAALVQVTCFVADARVPMTQFPGAAVNSVQLTRLSVQPETSCEGVGRLQTPGQGPTKLVFTGIQMAFGNQEQDLRLAFGRLGRALETMKTGYGSIFVMSVYSLNRAVAEEAYRMGVQYRGRADNPQGSIQIVEGLPSADAIVAIELIAAGP